MPSKKVLKELLRCMDCNGTGQTPEQNIINKLHEEVEEFAEAAKENKIADSVQLSCFNAFMETNPSIIQINRFEKYIKNTTGDELADIIITALAGAKKLSIDIDSHIQAKLRYNKIRSDHK